MSKADELRALAELEDWLSKRCAKIVADTSVDIKAGVSTDNPQCRQRLGQSQAFMITRSYVSGMRKALARAAMEDGR